MSGSLAKATSVDTGAIYHDVSPTIVCVLRLYNVAMFCMIIIAFVLCLVKGNVNETYYLLACNLVLSSMISIVVNWWYRGGDLPADKYWYIFLLATVIMFQCITTDIYVFTVLPTPDVTQAPIITWATINKSTISPQPTRTPNITTTSHNHLFVNNRA